LVKTTFSDCTVERFNGSGGGICVVVVGWGSFSWSVGGQICRRVKLPPEKKTRPRNCSSKGFGEDKFMCMMR